MKKIYFDEASYDAAFDRCVDVLAELIEKYADKFTMSDIGYDYCVYIGGSPFTITWCSYENSGKLFEEYYKRSYRKLDSDSVNLENKLCQKAS